MQIKGKITEVLLGISCLLLLGTTYGIYNQRKDFHELYERCIILKANEDTFHKVFLRNYKAILQTDFMGINPLSNMECYQALEKKSLSCAVLKGKIVLFVPEKSCNVCYDDVFEILQYSEKSMSVDPLIVTTKGKHNEVRNMVKDIGFQIDVYCLDDKDFWNSLHVVYAPFLSYVDEKLQCRHCFIPFPNHPDYTVTYLEHIASRYISE